MKLLPLGLFMLMISVQHAHAQTKPDSSLLRTYPKAQQEIINLSKQKWQWMAEKNVDKLATLFHDKSKFVHMSGTWKKKEELDIIKTGSIWYKKADIYDAAVEVVDDNAIIWTRLKLTSEVRGSDAIVDFTVTEVYKKEQNEWKLLALTFSSVREPHQIRH